MTERKIADEPLLCVLQVVDLSQSPEIFLTPENLKFFLVKTDREVKVRLSWDNITPLGGPVVPEV